MKKCIVYFPFKILENHPSASNIRPIKIIEGFKKIGYQVYVIKGYGDERKKIINYLKEKINIGEKFDFVYMESSTEPTLLTDANHLPTHPLMDFGFLKFCRKKGIKVGLFYRDIHWRFNQYKKITSLPKRTVAYIFYFYDLLKYKKCIDVIFLPSSKMENYIPIRLNKQVVELPSGCEKVTINKLVIKEKKHLSILYVGGLNKELYNIEEMVKGVYKNKTFTLDICCREDEWELNKKYYGQYLNNRIKVIHESGRALDEIATEKDLFSLMIEPTPYWEFAMPMKLFSYISYGKPIIGVNNTACGEFINRYSVGYTSDYNESSITELLEYIEKSYNHDYKIKIKALTKAFDENTWEARAKAVVESLNGDLIL